MCNSKEINNDMKRYLTTLFIAFVSLTANMAVAQQEGIQPKDTVKLRVLNEQVNEDGKTSNEVKLESKDERLFVRWVEEDTVYHIYTADTIVQLDAVPTQNEVLVIRGANAKVSGVSCFYSKNGTSHLSEDNQYAHYLCGLSKTKQGGIVNLKNRVTILKLSQNTHSDGIELMFAQDCGKGVKVRLWRVKPWSKDMNSLPVEVYIKQNNCNSPSLLKKDSIITLSATDTLKSISIEWNTGKNIFSPTLKIDDRLCVLEQQANHFILTDNLDSLLRNKGSHELLFEYKMFVSDKDGFKLEPYSVEFKIERNGPYKPSIVDKVKSVFVHFVFPNLNLLPFVLIFIVFTWIMYEAHKRLRKTPKFIKLSNKSCNLAGSSENSNEKDIPGTNGQSVTSYESHGGEDDAKGSKQVAHFDIDMKKEELLQQLQTLIGVIEKPEETLETNLVSKFLNNKIFKHYTKNRIKLLEKSEELNSQLRNLYKALEDGVVDKDVFYELKEKNNNLNQKISDLEKSRCSAREAAKSLYEEQLLFLLERLYITYVSESSDNKQLKPMVDLFNKKIDSSNPTELADRFKQKYINVLLAEIDLCFVSKNKKAEWCQKYHIIYNPKERLEVFVDNIYKVGCETGRAAKDKLEKQVSNLEEELKKTQEELKNRPVIGLIDTHKKEVEALNETIKGLEATIIELQEKHKVAISALETKHKEEVNKLTNAHKEQLAAIDVKHKREINDLNEAHKKEVGTLNATIKGFEATITELKKKHKEEISDIETKHEEQLGALKANYTQSINEIRQSHAEEVKKLVAKPNRWCNNFITEVRQMLDDLGQELHNLQTFVDEGPKTDRTIFVTVINEMVQFFGVFEANVNKLCDEKGNQDQIDLPAIRENLLTMFNKVLSYSGSWANRLFLLESYSRVPQLAVQMQSRGVDVATVERAVAIAKALFAKSGISVVVPAVLAAPFKNDNYDFENTEVLIYRFFPEVSPQDYSGRVFDLVRVGYDVINRERNKPVVVYF
jgi:hypothetical protein